MTDSEVVVAEMSLVPHGLLRSRTYDVDQRGSVDASVCRGDPKMVTSNGLLEPPEFPKANEEDDVDSDDRFQLQHSAP